VPITQIRKYWLILPRPALVTMERKRDAACIMVTLGESTLRHRATRNSFNTNEIAARGSSYLALVEQAHTGLAAYNRRMAICCVFITPSC
jgi:hypothetical protein